MNALQVMEALAEQAGIYLNLEEDDEKTLRDFEVKIAQQPTWPFEYSIGQVVGPDEIRSTMWDHECPEHPDYMLGHFGCDISPELEEQPSVIYIAEGGQDGYLNSDVARTLGWGRGR